MDRTARPAPKAALDGGKQAPVSVEPPRAPGGPLVVATPHSGRHYPPELLAASLLRKNQLERFEDRWLDQLLAEVPNRGGWLVRAGHARAFVDLNRAPDELDHLSLDQDAASFWRSSARARAGLGVVPTRLGQSPLYGMPLGERTVRRRLERSYWPYHNTLSRLLDRLARSWNEVVLVDCHSMPATAQPCPAAAVDVALGDRFRRSAAGWIVDHLEDWFQAEGLKVARNRPFAGGFVTEHYGRPEHGWHAVQIELRRGLYMNERNGRPLPAACHLRRTISLVLESLSGLCAERIGPALDDEAGPPLAAE